VRKVLELIEKDPDALQSTAGILSSYAFTVGGFLSTICAFLLGMLDYPLMRVYRGRGYFGVLILFHGLTMAVLAALFVVSIGLLVKAEWLDLAAVLTFVSLCQFALITAISVRLTLRAQNAPQADKPAAET
jgi:small-conductance mechanosensitive channel